MKYAYLGDTGIQVSELGFGTMSFGGDADKATSEVLYRAARDAGINFFDTADHYNHELSETYLGEFIENERHKLVISTKCYFPMSSDINDRGASRKHLFSSLHRSLKKLRTDYIDLFFVHHFDDKTSLEVTMRALDDMVRAGKILHPAASNFSAWQVMKAQGIACSQGLSRLACIQPMYSLVKRQAEVELLPMALSEKIGVTAYSPLGAGLLTGKYRSKSSSGRIESNEKYRIRYGKQAYVETAQRFVAFAEANGFNPVSLAIKWASSHRAVTSSLIGARSIEQLKDSFASVDIKMDEDLRSEISALSEEPAPATDRNEET